MVDHLLFPVGRRLREPHDWLDLREVWELVSWELGSMVTWEA